MVPVLFRDRLLFFRYDHFGFRDIQILRRRGKYSPRRKQDRQESLQSVSHWSSFSFLI